MPSKVIQPQSPTDLRTRALTRLTGRSDSHDQRSNSSAALGALYDLASSPTTAADALALLHELQVHQVELEMQDEELKRSRSELEASLERQTQRYDYAPFGYFTVDASLILCESNLAGARLLGTERDALLGRSLESFCTPESSRAMRAMLARIGAGALADSCALQLSGHDGKARTMRACANADSTGGRFLVALVEVSAEPAIGD